MIKIKTKIFLAFILLLVAGGFIAWQVKAPERPAGPANGKEITVFKSPTCGCCQGYIGYLKSQGFRVKAENVSDTLAIKEKYGISQELEACHTAVIDGYFVEGHVPVEAIDKLLAEKPKIKGIALPGMPSGAPGMTGPKLGSFSVYGLSDDGKVFDFFSL